MTRIRMETVAPKEVAKIVREALRKRYGGFNVTVTCDRGTAYGWIKGMFEISRPRDCYCEPRQPYCSRCREALNLASREAEKIVYEAMKKADAEFGSFYADDGYNTKHDSFSLQVSFIKI